MSTQKTIKESVSNTISNITPTPKLLYVVKNYALWFLAGVSVLMGGLAVSSIIFRTMNAPRAFGPHIPAQDILVALPFMWLGVFALVVYGAYTEIRKTDKGYRFELSTIVLALLLASCVLGIVFFAFGAGKRADNFAARHIPFHRSLDDMQKDQWMRPDRGLIIGVVASRTTESIAVEDREGVVWNIKIASGSDIVAENFPAIGERVGVHFAFATATNERIACDIRPLTLQDTFRNRFGERKDLPVRSNECGDMFSPK
jgi:cbb3-type cytochrome oxidase subunit 3